MDTPLQRRLTFLVGSVLTLMAVVLGFTLGPLDTGRRGSRQLLFMAGVMALTLGLSWWVGTRS
ncbi:hypothetical protein [Deinococcus sp. QL22]|uniref:hypothetical protein n=1 Tax=Deinococcus sp. QL22 TaxID=2939437 RepID=UPI002017A537|nr:hypothetical protein [Deinococcus sp. QL22]UQN08200.1 hypothetical protein M1R55_19155 [Deinococcus sp. QL22]